MFHSPFNSTLVDVPRPHLDPVCTLQEALAIVSLAARHPLATDTVLLQLDDKKRGVALSRITCTTPQPGHHGSHDTSRAMVRNVVEECTASQQTVHAFVVTFRSASPVGAGDVAVLHHLDSSLRSAGFHLLDWVVVGRGGFWCPRVLTDAPDPWDLTLDR